MKRDYVGLGMNSLTTCTSVFIYIFNCKTEHSLDISTIYLINHIVHHTDFNAMQAIKHIYKPIAVGGNWDPIKKISDLGECSMRTQFKIKFAALAKVLKSQLNLEN